MRVCLVCVCLVCVCVRAFGFELQIFQIYAPSRAKLREVSDDESEEEMMVDVV